MKKLLVILIVVLLAFGAWLTWHGARPADAPAPAEAPAPAASETPAAPDETPAEPVVIREIDYDAVRALRAEDETVLTVAGESATWREFCDLLQSTGMDIQNYFSQMAAYYGVSADWEGSTGDGSGQTYAQYAVSETREYLESILTVRAFAAAHGVTLDEEELASLEPQAMADAVLGQGTALEDFYARLESEAHMSFETYRAMREASLLYSKTLSELYGGRGEKLSEEEAVAYLEEQGYLAAHHILLMTIDPNTGDALDEATVNEKKARAGEIAAELQAIEDQEELLRRFTELKAELCEDSGKERFPDGYTFQPGTMVQEFEDAVRSLSEYAVSDPVETAYGYHVIMRLPLKGDAPLTNLQGTSATARQELAQKRITEELDAFQTEHPAEFAEGLEDFDLTPYIQ